MSEWSELVDSMMVSGTLAPLPIIQELEPIYKIFMTPAVAKITHENGTPLNVTNVLDTAVSLGHLRYCSLFECEIPACSKTIKLDNKKYHQKHKFQGFNVYKEEHGENYLFYDGIAKSWILSPDFDSNNPIMKTATCPQQGKSLLILISLP